MWPRKTIHREESSRWFLKYRIGGKPVTIPSGTQDYEEAVAILQQKVAQATQPCRSDDFPSVVINQMLDLVTEDYRSKNRYTTYDVEHRVARSLERKSPLKSPLLYSNNMRDPAPAMLCPQL